MSSPNSTTPTTHADLGFAPLGTQGNGVSPSQGRSIDVVRFTLEHWKKLVVGGCLGLLVGSLCYLYAGPQYVGSTRVLVSKPPGTPLQEGGVSTYGDTDGHVHLIKSDVIVSRAFEKHDLGKLPSLAGSDEPQIDVIEGLVVKRTAGQNRDFQSIIDIAYTSSSQQDAQIVTRAIVEAYAEYLARVRQDNTQEVLDVFSQADVKLQRDVARLEAEYQQFRQDAPILFTIPVGKQTANGTVVTPPNHYLQEVDRIRKNLSALSNRRTDVLAQRDVLKAMLAAGDSRQQVEHLVMLALSRPSASAGGEAGAGGGTGTGNLFAGPPAKERLDAELLKQKVEAAKLAHHIGDDHPAAVKTQQAIHVIMNAYRAEGLVPPRFQEDVVATGDAADTGVDIASVYMKFLETQLKQMTYAEAEMKQELDVAIAEAKDAATYEVRDKQLSDELQRKKDLYNELVQRLEKLDLTREQTGFRMQPISKIQVEKSLKRIIKIVGAGGILGTLLVFGGLYFREWQDLSMKSLDEVRRYADADVLGSVPHFGVDLQTRSRGGSELSGALCYLHRPGSREAEAFRAVRTTLFISTTDDVDRVIQISSPEPGDGKSLSAANLAVAVAQSGKRMLLIDGDLRRPTIHELFGMPPHVGLAEVLRCEIEWINAVRQTTVDGLSVMTAGEVPANPAELLSTSHLGRMLQAARQEFDYVFIDSPPILAVSDPCIISQHVDGLLLVIRMRKNKRPAVIRTRDILDAHGVHLYGVIANDLDEISTGHEDYRNYAEYYAHNEPAASQTSQPVV